MQIVIGNPELAKATFSPFPIRLLYGIAAALILVLPAVLTPSIHLIPITFGEFELIIFITALFLVYRACISQRETYFSLATKDGITVTYSVISGIFSRRQRVEEYIPWHAIKQVNLMENEDAYWLNALVDSDGDSRIVDLVAPGLIEANEAKRLHEILSKFRIGNT